MGRCLTSQGVDGVISDNIFKSMKLIENPILCYDSALQN